MIYDPRRCMLCRHGVDDHDDYIGCIDINCDCTKFVGITGGAVVSGSGGS